MSDWNDLGFRANPYNTDPVPPNDEGLRLLVGRQKELQQLRRSLTSSVNHATIEGANGVGKTSVVGVAGFTLLKDHLEDRSKPLYIPVPRSFQLSSGRSADDFSMGILLALASEVVAQRNLIEGYVGDLPSLNKLETWLNDPVVTGGGGGLNFVGVGASASVTPAVNAGVGFAQGGLEFALRKIMSDIFKPPRSGAFICVLDNLELLHTSAKARAILEELRDGILSFPGLKWVLCGARGPSSTVWAFWKPERRGIAGVLGSSVDLWCKNARGGGGSFLCFS